MNSHCLSLAALFAAGCVALLPSSAFAADATRGHEIYVRVGCWQCHGYGGQGAGTGPKLGPNPLPVEVIREKIRVPGDRMPPYREAVLSDEEIADIHAYLETLPPPSNLEDTILAE